MKNATRPLCDVVALVTGASRGAGKGIALALAEDGATVYVAARSSRRDGDGGLGTVEATAEEVDELGGRGIPVVCDCRSSADVRRVLDRIERDHGRLDVLVLSAWGGHDGEISPEESSLAKTVEVGWKLMIEGGVRPALLTAALAGPLLRQSTGPLVVSVSFWDNDRYLGELVYDLAMNAFNRLVCGLAAELAGDGTAVALSPGYMRTERVEAALAEKPELAEVFGEPSESTRYVGRAVAALAADPDRRRHSGQTLRVADLARDYGFHDLDGSQPAPFHLPDASRAGASGETAS